MKAIRAISALGVVAMSIALVIGFTSGDFGEEGGQIVDLIWGRITLVDLYVGIALFAAFVAWRERSPARWLPWLAAFVVLGNLATAIYVLVASTRSDTVEELLSPVP